MSPKKQMTTAGEADSRAKLLAGAGRGFRAKGYAGLGVDSIAKDAGLTSGSFYSHFKSKNEVFLETLRIGLQGLADGIDHVRSTDGSRWRDGLVDFYLTVRRHCPPDEACALQAMTGDVERLGPDARRVFEAELGHVVERMTLGAPESEIEGERRRALALLALLSGAVTMARSCEDQALADEIVAAARWLAGKAE